MLNLIFFVIGLLAAVVINMLADYLPSSHTPLKPQWATWGWSKRKRPLLVFVGTAVLFASLPTFLGDVVDTAVNSFHIAVLILIIVTDLEHKLNFDAVTLPATAIALLTSLFVSPAENSIRLALVGAVVGYAVFYLLYWVAQLIYGPGRGVHESMRAGRFRLAGDGGNTVSRVQVEDLAALVEAALLSELTGAYPVADTEPCTSREMAQFCAQLLGLPMPPSAPDKDVHHTRRVNRRRSEEHTSELQSH